MLHHDVAHFCIAPGSRSTPLTSSVAKNKNCSHTVHFDERSLAFYALGYAKASKKPVAIIVTSGTATANLLPAIMEAYESMVPLIILTADRPAELLYCGANQATNQINMFSNFVRCARSFQAIDPFTPMEALQSQVSFAMQVAKDPIGPVHLNFMFREPFVNDLDHDHDLEYSCRPIKKYVNPEKMVPPTQYDPLISKLNASEKTLIICGLDSMDIESFQKVCLLSKRLKAPIFCDILSNHHKMPHQENVIAHGSLLFKTSLLNAEYRPEVVLHFGGSFVSKHLYFFLHANKPSQYVHISPHKKIEDPFNLTSHVFTETTFSFCRSITSRLNETRKDHFLKCWQSAEALAKAAKESVLKIAPENPKHKLSEPWLFQKLSKFDLSKHNVFIANSMPIRDAHDFLHPQKGVYHIYGNRGVSGIDGNLSTVIGIAKASKRKTLAIVGDLTFLHDMTALSLLNKDIPPVTIIVINNNGGCIFRNFPIYKEKNIYEEFFEIPHNLTFSAIKELFNISYSKANSAIDACDAIRDALACATHSIIEIELDASNSTSERAQILDILKLEEAVLC